MSPDNLLLQAIKQTNNKNYRTKQNHIAFIFNRSKLIAIGVNKTKTHPLMSKHPYGSQLHMCAELDAINKCGNVDFSRFSMVVLRVRSSGALAYSKPCKGCHHLLKELGFKEITYSNNLGGLETLNL